MHGYNAAFKCSAYICCVSKLVVSNVNQLVLVQVMFVIAACDRCNWLTHSQKTSPCAGFAHADTHISRSLLHSTHQPKPHQLPHISIVWWPLPPKQPISCSHLMPKRAMHSSPCCQVCCYCMCLVVIVGYTCKGLHTGCRNPSMFQGCNMLTAQHLPSL